MSPDLALCLYPEGIRLERRTPVGWHLLDEVALDDPDLIVPGQALRLPTTRTPSSDGDR